ncbi:MAG: hypothetical protein JRI54_01995, partial [Deltaproteobacteria bacterium]|nr:hypothetical protein [Deltaproteobacteria bacterium]
LIVDENGMITGSITSITDSTQETGHIIYGFMSQDRTDVFLLIGPSEQEFIAIIGIKGGGSFLTADLAGAWYCYGSAGEGSMYGPVTINNSGTITPSATMTTPEGPVTVTGNFTLSGSGIMGGTVTGDGDTSTVGGKMDQGKTRSYNLFTDAGGNGDNGDDGDGDTTAMAMMAVAAAAALLIPLLRGKSSSEF